MASIDSLLHRRTDLSTFLVHLTRDSDDATARENLLRILEKERLEARSVYGPGLRFRTDNQPFQDSQKVCCFSETPLEHVWMMCEDIEGRNITFSEYGFAVTKAWARRSHVNPVWYLDISARGGRDWLTEPINALLEEASKADAAGGTPLHESYIAQITPFIEQMGPTRAGRKEFWWEREWRHIGALTVPWPHIVAIFVPEPDHKKFYKEMSEGIFAKYRKPPLLDVRWGLERMISQMSGINPDDAGPLPVY